MTLALPPEDLARLRREVDERAFPGACDELEVLLHCAPDLGDPVLVAIGAAECAPALPSRLPSGRLVLHSHPKASAGPYPSVALRPSRRDVEWCDQLVARDPTLGCGVVTLHTGRVLVMLAPRPVAPSSRSRVWRLPFGWMLIRTTRERRTP